MSTMMYRQTTKRYLLGLSILALNTCSILIIFFCTYFYSWPINLPPIQSEIKPRPIGIAPSAENGEAWVLWRLPDRSATLQLVTLGHSDVPSSQVTRMTLPNRGSADYPVAIASTPEGSPATLWRQSPGNARIDFAKKPGENAHRSLECSMKHGNVIDFAISSNESGYLLWRGAGGRAVVQKFSRGCGDTSDKWANDQVFERGGDGRLEPTSISLSSPSHPWILLDDLQGASMSLVGLDTETQVIQPKTNSSSFVVQNDRENRARAVDLTLGRDGAFFALWQWSKYPTVNLWKVPITQIGKTLTGTEFNNFNSASRADYPRGLAVGVSTNSDGEASVLWDSGAGMATIWTLDPNLSVVRFQNSESVPESAR